MQAVGRTIWDIAAERGLGLKLVRVDDHPRRKQERGRAERQCRPPLVPPPLVEFVTGDGLYIYPDPAYLCLDHALLVTVDCSGKAAADCRELFRALREAWGLPYPAGLPKALGELTPEALQKALQSPPPVEEEPGEAAAVEPGGAGPRAVCSSMGFVDGGRPC